MQVSLLSFPHPCDARVLWKALRKAQTAYDRIECEQHSLQFFQHSRELILRRNIYLEILESYQISYRFFFFSFLYIFLFSALSNERPLKPFRPLKKGA